MIRQIITTHDQNVMNETHWDVDVPHRLLFTSLGGPTHIVHLTSLKTQLMVSNTFRWQEIPLINF